MDTVKTSAMLTYVNTRAEGLLSKCEYPWQALPLIGHYITQLISSIDLTDFIHLGDNVVVHKSVTIADTAHIMGPTLIDEGSDIRPGAFIRGNALIGKHCVVGNASEIKNSILLESCQVPHFNYVGDSILGRGAHLGAGSIASNLKADKSNIVVHLGGEKMETGLRKFGAIVGDHADVGCNAVLAPGSLIGPGSRVYPLSFVRGNVPAHSIYKNKMQGEITAIRE